MDANKRLKLVQIGYEIRPSCGTCVHGKFRDHGEDFGTCAIHGYEHLKHSDSLRELSIFRFGHCSEHVLDKVVESTVHGFREFIK